jgi:hypothetical protein
MGERPARRAARRTIYKKQPPRFLSNLLRQLFYWNFELTSRDSNRISLIWAAAVGVAVVVALAVSILFIRNATRVHWISLGPPQMETLPKDTEPHARFPEVPAISRQRLK